MDEQEWNIDEQIEKFDKICGRIISNAVHLESVLEFFIMNYFVKPQSPKTFFFNNTIIKDMGFEKKRKIFEEICKKEGYDAGKLKEIVLAIKEVQTMRNDVAHQEVTIDPINKTLTFGNRKKDNKFIVNPDEKMLEKIEKERIKAIEGIIDFYQDYSKNGTFDEKLLREQ